MLADLSWNQLLQHVTFSIWNNLFEDIVGQSWKKLTLKKLNVAILWDGGVANYSLCSKL